MKGGWMLNQWWMKGVLMDGESIMYEWWMKDGWMMSVSSSMDELWMDDR
jgi:hypothetical protein